MTLPFKPCAVIPIYNHERALPAVASQLAPRLPLLLVNDGSGAECRALVQSLAEGSARIAAVHRPANGGKGAAVKTGLREAAARGFSHALQIDADGQHRAGDAARFLAAARAQPAALIAGFPVFDGSAPRLRQLARQLTHFWVWVNTLSLDIRDSMCGFRVYPLAASCRLLDGSALGDGMDFDPEFLVRWHWSGQPLVQLPTRVTYPRDGVSHFRAWRDNQLISWMHTRLFFGMLLRLPSLLRARAHG